MTSQLSDSCTSCGKAVSGMKRCSRCHVAKYCSRECQVADWKLHKRVCTVTDGSDSASNLKPSQAEDSRDPCNSDLQMDGPDDVVLGVKINCGPIGANRFEPERFPKTHKIFTRGELCPFPVLYGEEILLYSPLIDENRPFLGSSETGAGSCQPAVYLRIEPDNGFAPFHWQSNDPGPCYVVRKDLQPLSVKSVDMMYSYHSDLLSSTHFEEPPDARAPINRKTFADYCKYTYK